MQSIPAYLPKRLIRTALSSGSEVHRFVLTCCYALLFVGWAASRTTTWAGLGCIRAVLFALQPISRSRPLPR